MVVGDCPILSPLIRSRPAVCLPLERFQPKGPRTAELDGLLQWTLSSSDGQLARRRGLDEDSRLSGRGIEFGGAQRGASSPRRSAEQEV